MWNPPAKSAANWIFPIMFSTARKNTNGSCCTILNRNTPPAARPTPACGATPSSNSKLCRQLPAKPTLTLTNSPPATMPVSILTTVPAVGASAAASIRKKTSLIFFTVSVRNSSAVFCCRSAVIKRPKCGNLPGWPGWKSATSRTVRTFTTATSTIFCKKNRNRGTLSTKRAKFSAAIRESGIIPSASAAAWAFLPNGRFMSSASTPNGGKWSSDTTATRSAPH